MIRLEQRPMRDDQHQPAALEPIDQEPQRLQRGRIGPVQILDDDQQWGKRQPALEDRAQGEEDLAPDLLRLDMPERGIWCTKTEYVEKERHETLGFVRREPQLRQQGGKFAASLRRRV